MNYYLDAIKRYVDFDGKATRKEYWMFVLINFLVSLVVGFVDGLIGTAGILSIAYGLFMFIPSIAIAVRRLHDTGRSGWWLLINLVPLIGFIWFFILMVLPSKENDLKNSEEKSENI